MSVIYITYDKNLQKHFDKNNIRSLLTGLSVTNKEKQFWVYDRTDSRVNEILAEWYAGRK